MPRMKNDEVPLQLVIPKSANAALRKMADAEGIKSVSEFVRRLLEEHCRRNGLDVNFSIGNWGGTRKTK